MLRARFPFVAAGAVAGLAAIAFSLACMLTSDVALAPSGTSSVIERLFGASRRAMGEHFCVEADRYFHRGVPHQRERSFTDTIARLADTVSPRTHEHLSGSDTYEMMPWLRFATWMDPGNVEAYLGAAFWVARQRDGRLPQALEILAEGRRKNPSDYRIPMEEGSILLHYGDLAGAERAFDLALRLWPGAERCSEEQKRLDRAALLNSRGFLYELRGDAPDALACYRECLRIRPGSPGIGEIIGQIERGARTRADAEALLHSVFLAGPVRGEHEECSRVGHGEHDHGHGHE